MYYRQYVSPRAAEGAPEGFAILTCDHDCRAAVAVPFTEADAHPMALVTEATVAAGWQLMGADDRCPAHLLPEVPARANVPVQVPAREVRAGDVARMPGGKIGTVESVEIDFHTEAGDVFTRIVANISGVRSRRVLLSAAEVTTYPARRVTA